jgi:hypothetical protein
MESPPKPARLTLKEIKDSISFRNQDRGGDASHTTLGSRRLREKVSGMCSPGHSSVATSIPLPPSSSSPSTFLFPFYLNRTSTPQPLHFPPTTAREVQFIEDLNQVTELLKHPGATGSVSRPRPRSHYTSLEEAAALGSELDPEMEMLRLQERLNQVRCPGGRG